MGLFRLLIVGIVIYAGYRLVTSLSRSLRSPPAGTPPPPAKDGRSPYEILGVTSSASPAEIRAAYQRLIQQYHPDRVAEMGPELRELAEQRTKEINVAYDKLKRR
jgi:DnaJ-class molecular chaperone